MVNYQLGKIYKIVDNTNGDIYIGSTCEPNLARRLATHIGDYKKYLEGKRVNITSFQIFDNNNYDIILIENYPCERKDELHARERYYIESLKCVNKQFPGRTKNEYCKIHKEDIKQYNAQYRNENKEKIHQQQNVKTSCLCGCRYTNNHKSQHEQTNLHQNYINNLSSNQP